MCKHTTAIRIYRKAGGMPTPLVNFWDLDALTGTVSQVMAMNRSLPDDRLYDRLMLQLVGTAGTVGEMKT